MLYVPYKGSGAMLPDLLSGRVNVAIDNVLLMAQYIKKGQVTGLAVTGRKPLTRVARLADRRGDGCTGFSRDRMVRRLRSGQDAASDRAKAQCRACRDHAPTRRCESAARTRRGAAIGRSRRVASTARAGDGAMEQGDPRGGHQG